MEWAKTKLGPIDHVGSAVSFRIRSSTALGRLVNSFGGQNLSKLRGESCQGERLLEQHGIGFQYSVMHDGTVCVSRHVENLDSRAYLNDALGELAPPDSYSI